MTVLQTARNGFAVQLIEDVRYSGKEVVSGKLVI
jgi:hypothetical protein